MISINMDVFKELVIRLNLSQLKALQRIVNAEVNRRKKERELTAFMTNQDLVETLELSIQNLKTTNVPLSRDSLKSDLEENRSVQ